MGWLNDTWNSAKNAASKFAADPAGHLKSAGNFLKETGKYIAEEPARASQLAAKGAVQGTSSLVGMVGDLGMFAYNRGIRHGLNALGTDLKESDFSCSNWVENRIYDIPGLGSLENVEAETDYERAILYASQGVTEIGAFIAVSAVTMGTGGAALAAVRGGSIAARGMSAAGSTARILSPFASKTAFVAETGFAGLSIKSNFEEAGQNAELANGVLPENLVAASDEHITEMRAETVELLKQLGIDPNNVTIEALQNAGVEVDQMPKSALKELGIDFEKEAYLNNNRTVTSDITRSGQAGTLSENFAVAKTRTSVDNHDQEANTPVISGPGMKSAH